MKKKIAFISVFLIVLLVASNIFAATVNSKKATLEIVENNVCTIDITDFAKFEKKITSYDLKNKEITIGLKVVNEGIAPLDSPSEIVLLMDNSLSMRETISTGGSRMQAVATSAKTFANELLKLPTVKISVVSFSTVNNNGLAYGQEGYINEGTLADARVRTALTQDKTTIMDAIEEIANDTTGIRTDIDAGLTLASQQFSGTIDNRIIILLTDGVPNISLGSNEIRYSEPTSTNTKNKLQSLAQSGIDIYSMMTGVTDDVEVQTGETFKALAEEVFGTPANPTVGKFYYITDDEIEETISNTILNDLKAPQDGILNDIDIVDYFPQEIVDNFDFSVVDEPNIGTVSSSIDLQNNEIVWHIDRLSYGETATMSYKLKLKDKINDEILDKILNTNEKVDITAEDLTPKTSDVTPKIKVELPSEPTPDTTVSPDPIPQTGALITIYIIAGLAVAGAVGFGLRAYMKNQKLK